MAGTTFAGAFAAVAQVFGLQGAVEPAVAGVLHARRPGLHVILRVEVGTAHVGRAASVDNGEMTLIVKRLERRQRRMEPKEAVKIDNLVLRNGDCGSHGVVILFAVRDDSIQTVGRAALENDNEPLAGSADSLSQHGANQETWDGRGAGYGKRAFVEKESPTDLHVLPLS
jgi:hypothetical protein